MFDPKKQSFESHANEEFLRRMIGERYKRTSPPSAPVFNPSVMPETRNVQEDSNMPALAMVYAPVQKWQSIISPDAALQEGTIFRELDKPFLGARVTRR